MSSIPNQPKSGDTRPVTARNGHHDPELVTRFFTAITDAGMYQDFELGMALGEKHAAAGTVDEALISVFDAFTGRGSKVDPESVRFDLYAGGYFIGATYADLQAVKASR